MVSWNLKSGSRVSGSSAGNWASDKRLLAWATREKDGTLIKLWLHIKKTQTLFSDCTLCARLFGTLDASLFYFETNPVIPSKIFIDHKICLFIRGKVQSVTTLPIIIQYRPTRLVHQDSLPFHSPVNLWEVLAQSWPFDIGLLFSGGGGSSPPPLAGSYSLEMENMDENDDKVEILCTQCTCSSTFTDCSVVFDSRKQLDDSSSLWGERTGNTLRTIKLCSGWPLR